MLNRKLGRRTRAHNNFPHYSQLRRAVRAPAIPVAKTWLSGMPQDLGFALNNELGCCSISGLHHWRQIETFNALGLMTTDMDKDVLADYEQACGYKDGDPSTDNGGCLQDVLKYATTVGITTDNSRDKLLGVVEVDPRLQSDVREVIAFTPAAYIGIEIPESWTQSEAGAIWDVTDSPNAGGHCVILAGYDADSFDVISWGMRFKMTNAAFAKYCDEAYGLIGKSWIESTGETPGGISLYDLQQAMQSIAMR